MGTDESPSSHPVDVSAMARGPEWSKIEQGIDSEPVPSHLNTINSSGLFHIVSADKMSVRYAGNQQHGHDVGVVQADCAAPVKRTAYYFEMTVKSAGMKGQMAIGFTNQQFKMRRQPGWEANICGYHGDDGYLCREYGKGESFGPTFRAGDTVGAGINYASQEFFFILSRMGISILLFRSSKSGILRCCRMMHQLFVSSFILKDLLNIFGLETWKILSPMLKLHWLNISTMLLRSWHMANIWNPVLDIYSTCPSASMLQMQ